MQEYLTEAIVLGAEPSGDADTRFSLFTRGFGKLKARGKSARKITSKLSGHLQAGNIVVARLIEKNGLQVVDALKEGVVRIGLPQLYLLDRIVSEGEADGELWNLLTSEDFSWQKTLALLGWDPLSAQCVTCGAGKPAAFVVGAQEFYCISCASKLGRNEVLLLYES